MGKVFGRKRSPLVSSIRANVQSRETRRRIVWQSAGLQQPSPKGLQRGRVAAACGNSVRIVRGGSLIRTAIAVKRQQSLTIALNVALALFNSRFHSQTLFQVCTPFAKFSNPPCPLFENCLGLMNVAERPHFWLVGTELMGLDESGASQLVTNLQSTNKNSLEHSNVCASCSHAVICETVFSGKSFFEFHLIGVCVLCGR